MFSIDHWLLRPPRLLDSFFDPLPELLRGLAFGAGLGCRLPVEGLGVAGRLEDPAELRGLPRFPEELPAVGLGVAGRWLRPEDGLAPDSGCRLVRLGRAICS